MPRFVGEIREDFSTYIIIIIVKGKRAGPFEYDNLNWPRLSPGKNSECNTNRPTNRKPAMKVSFLYRFHIMIVLPASTLILSLLLHAVIIQDSCCYALSYVALHAGLYRDPYACLEGQRSTLRRSQSAWPVSYFSRR